MSFTDHTPFMPSQSPYAVGSDAVNCWPTFPMNNEDQHSQFEQQGPPFKRPRNSEETQLNPNPMPYPPAMNSRMHPTNAPVNKGANHIFYKTRMCVNYKGGVCRNGENCNYAHGIEDMRQPPPNWQELVPVRDNDNRPLTGNWEDNQKLIHRFNLCKKFLNGEECPYGNRCNFRHEDPGKVREESSRGYRENSAINIGTTGQPMTQGSSNNQSEDDRSGNRKPSYRTRICIKWEQTGSCVYGSGCHFAHGQAELKVPGALVEAEVLSSAPISMKPQAAPANDSSTIAVAAVPGGVKEEVQGKKCGFKWRGSMNINQINRIYGDWLDDVPLVES